MDDQLIIIKTINDQIQEKEQGLIILKDELKIETKKLQLLCPHVKYKELHYSIATIKYCVLCRHVK